MTISKALPYRRCAGVLLINQNGLLFAAKRADNQGDFLQAVQGGIDEGETPLEAAIRELKEEIDVINAELLVEYPQTLKYDFPPELIGAVLGGKYCGQEQHWFVMRFTGEDSEINIHGVETPEFREWTWTDAQTLIDRSVAFKKAVFQTLLTDQKIIPYLRKSSIAC